MVRYFIQLGRPQFLGGSVAFYSLGVAIAFHLENQVHWRLFVEGLLIAISIQLLVHYTNDYFDLEADQGNTAPTFWAGGSRVLPDGLLNPRVSLMAGLVFTLIAIVASLFLVILEDLNFITLGLLLLAIGLAWSYSSPPFDFHSNGLGELASIIIIPLLGPLIGFYIQMQVFDQVLWMAVSPLCCLQLNAMIGVELPDFEADVAAHRKNIVIWLGRKHVRWLYCFMLVACYLLFLIVELPIPVVLLVSLTLPVAVFVGWKLLTIEPDAVQNWSWLSFASFALMISVVLLEMVGFVAFK